METKKQHNRNHWVAIIIGIFVALSVTADAKTYSFKVEKTGSGEPIILIPGLTCDGSVWDETVERLSRNNTCYVLTLPGFAGHDKIDITDGYLNQVEEELSRFIKKEKLKDATLIGHSLGGYLALSLSANNPDYFSKLAIIDGLPFMGAAQNPAATEEMMKPIAKNMMTMYDTMTDAQYSQQQKMVLYTMITDPDKIDIAYEWGISSDRKTVGQAMYELFTTDLRDEIATIKAPTLVLGSWIGYKDYGVTREMVMNSFNMQFAKLEGAKIKLSDNGKHFIMWDDFDFFIAEIEAFLLNSTIEG